MRYVLKIEAIGDNYRYHLDMYSRSRLPFTKREIHAYQLGNRRLTPWVAKVTGIDGRFGIRREFVKGQKDWSDANGTGSRGIWIYYFLEPGIYEINERTSWQRARRYFARVVNDRTLQEMSREEVMRCLQ